MDNSHRNRSEQSPALEVKQCVSDLGNAKGRTWYTMGVPCDTKSAAKKFLICRSRKTFATGVAFTPSSCGPSPQFHDWLFSSPSALFSPFASLCLRFVQEKCQSRDRPGKQVVYDSGNARGRTFSLYETKSRNVNPSCAVMKLIEWYGFLPESL